ncbi:Inner membrane protein yfeZ [Citrobacter freundii]|nr:Inner membrane protein yfeZ [Citrobacter freundii]
MTLMGVCACLSSSGAYCCCRRAPGVLFVIAGSSREQGSTLLNLFYPDHDAFWLGLLPGVPAVLAFLLSGRRFVFPVVWRWLRGLLILAQLALLCWQPVMWLAGEPINGVGLAVLVADVVALIWLLTNQRLRACFSLEKE